MNKLAKEAGITQPGLRVITLKGGNPTESNIRKLARVMKVHPTQLYRLVYEDKVRAIAEPDAIDVLMQVFDDIFNALHKLAGQSPENQRRSDYELLETALRTIKSVK